MFSQFIFVQLPFYIFLYLLRVSHCICNSNLNMLNLVCHSFLNVFFLIFYWVADLNFILSKEVLFSKNHRRCLLWTPRLSRGFLYTTKNICEFFVFVWKCNSKNLILINPYGNCANTGTFFLIIWLKDYELFINIITIAR